LITVQEISSRKSRGADPSTGKIHRRLRADRHPAAHHRQAVRHGHRASAAPSPDLPGPSQVGVAARRTEPERGSPSHVASHHRGSCRCGAVIWVACVGKHAPVPMWPRCQLLLRRQRQHRPTAPSAGPQSVIPAPSGRGAALKRHVVVVLRNAPGHRVRRI